jgi:hypothetical protein
MMNFEYTLFHPKGEIKVKVTGATANAAMATVQMGHEIVAMMGGNVAGQAPVEIAPEPVMQEVQPDPIATAFDTPVVAPTVADEINAKMGAVHERALAATIAANNAAAIETQVDSAGTPFDPELHTGTLKKDGTWRLKKGAASKVEEPESEEADEGEPEGNALVGAETVAPDAAGIGTTTEEKADAPPVVETQTEVTPVSNEDDQPDITDTELQRYCGRLTQHFGSAEPVFALAAKHVPDGDMPRPTAIKDQAARRAFIEEAQEQTGVVYHG